MILFLIIVNLADTAYDCLSRQPFLVDVGMGDTVESFTSKSFM